MIPKTGVVLNTGIISKIGIILSTSSVLNADIVSKIGIVTDKKNQFFNLTFNSFNLYFFHLLIDNWQISCNC